MPHRVQLYDQRPLLFTTNFYGRPYLRFLIQASELTALSPANCSTMHRPLTLQQLADCLDKDSHICLVQPFPYPWVCKKRFDTEDNEARKRAISNTRSALEKSATGASVSNATYRNLLESIARDCCCPNHRKDDIFEQFAYHWMASGILDSFLERQGWRWETEKWLCLRSDEKESCPPLRKVWKPLHRNAIYCSLNRLAIFAEYPGYFDESFIQSAIDEFVKYWTCESHKIDAEQIRYELKTNFRIHTYKNSPPRNITISDKSQEHGHSDPSSGLAGTCENEDYEDYPQDQSSSSVSDDRASETPGQFRQQKVVSAAAASPLSSSLMTPLDETHDQRFYDSAKSGALINDEIQSSPDSSPSGSRGRRLVTPVSALHGRSKSGAVHPISSLTDEAQYTGIRNHGTFTPSVIVDLTKEDGGSVSNVPTTTTNSNLKIAIHGSSGRSVSAGPSSPSYANRDPVTPERPGPPKSSASAPAVRSRLSDSTITSRNQDVHRSSSNIYAKPNWASADEESDCIPTRGTVAATLIGSSHTPKSTGIEFQDSLPLGSKETLESIAHSILGLAKQPARTKPKSGEPYKCGWIYIFRIPDMPGYVKIGRTTQLITKRKRQISNCKQKLELEVVDKSCYQKISNHERVEKLIHEDLKNERCFFRCPCARTRDNEDSHGKDGYTDHGEWFKIDEEEASLRVERWRQWMRQEPYDGAGDMKSDFRRRVDYCEKHMKNLQEEEDAEERWKTFMTPFCMTD